MTTTITNYTTYDLEYYYADLKRLPRLSREERQCLVTGMSGAQVSPAMPRETQVKHQLIEGYLPFAKHLAITLCPPTLYHRLLPDLIGAVNLAVVEATMRCDLSSTMSLDAYIAAYVRGAIKQTLVKDDLLNIPFRARERARAEGTLEYLYAHYRVASLDELMAWFETDEVEEPPLKPSFPPRPHRCATRSNAPRWKRSSPISPHAPRQSCACAMASPTTTSAGIPPKRSCGS